MVMAIPCSKKGMARAAEAEDDGDGGSEEEYDRVFYEDIEAPKFVDLTAPDAARPTDDPFWFCLRIGCDQNHEHVDPEALHRSFFLRVMAARSPNVRLQKAIRRRNQSSMLKCPHSAPPKPPRARIARLSTATEAAEKVKTHRICTLRSSPTRAKTVRIEASSARKKALTTPRSKPVRPRQEPFLSANHQKEPVAAARKGTVVKALFMTTPKKDANQAPAKGQAEPPLSEVCSKMRKLNLACREVPIRYLCQSSNQKTAKKCNQTAAKSIKTAQESRTDVKKKILGCSLKRANSEVGKENRSGRQNTAADENACTETADSHEERTEVVQESRIEVETSQTDNYDDNKENLSYVDQPTEKTVISSHFEGESLQRLENNENVPMKEAKMQIKVNAEQGGKLKKTTHPKPFRLRTDERRVLKEANPERHQTLTENNSMATLKDGNRAVLDVWGSEAASIKKQRRAGRPAAGTDQVDHDGAQQTGRCHDGKGRHKPTCGDKLNKQIRNVAGGQLDEAKRVLKSIRCNTVKPAMTNGKVVGKSRRASRAISSTRNTKITSCSIGKKKASVKISRLQAAAA